MHVDGIGELLELGAVWRLRYSACGHVQEIAREGLEEPAQAEHDMRRHFAQCLSCQLAEAKRHHATPDDATACRSASPRRTRPRRTSR
jgi:hypothetical protein